MSFSIDDIPKIHYDLSASIKLVSNNKSVARELALMLQNDIADFIKKFEEAFRKGDSEEIQNIAHKLHGGICYVIAPRLQYLIQHLETACKQEPNTIEAITPFIIPSLEKFNKVLTETFV